MKNVFENLIYIAVMAILMGINTYVVLKSQENVILTAINKQTTEIQNTYEKIKVAKKSELKLDTKNTTTDSIKEPHRKFRLFGKRLPK